MKAPSRGSGSSGWLLLAAGVIAWDAAAPETMSDAFKRGCATPQGVAVLGLAWAVLTAHLFAALPERADPFLLAGKITRYRRIA
jgi:hypothetical protein